MNPILLSIALLAPGQVQATAAAPQTPLVPLVDSLEYPGPQRFWNKAGLVISPARAVALVGSEVPMFAGICDGQGHLQAYERVEWMLEPTGVGAFSSVAEAHRPFFLELVSSKPKKIDNNYAVGETFAENVILTRGTADITDDIVMPRGYTWVTVTSPREGTSYITAMGPDVYSWDARQKSAVIHWIDADWVFPGPASLPVGAPATQTTCVTRHTTKAPVSDWIVKYTITGGAAAGFAPDNQQSVEMATNEQGQSTVELVPAASAPGTTCVAVELIRSECATPGNEEKLLVASAATSITWTSAQANLRILAPATTTVGATANYRIEASNTGAIPVNDATVSLQPPAGLAYVKSDPAPEGPAGPFTWRLGQIAAGELKSISVDFRAEQPGAASVCASLSGPDAVAAQSCATTNVIAVAVVQPPVASPVPAPSLPPTTPVPTLQPTPATPAQPTPPAPTQPTPQPPPQPAVAPKIELHLTGPQTAVVGREAHFELEVVNTGTVPANDLEIADNFDPGLEYGTTQKILKQLGSIPVGQSKKVGVTFRVTKPGRLCHTMEVTGPGGIHESAPACLNATEQTSIKLEIDANPKIVQVGGTVEFAIAVTNVGDIPAQQVKTTITFEQGLQAERASEGFKKTVDGGVLWTIDTLPPGAKQIFTVQCTCIAPAARANGKVTVVDQTGLPQSQQAPVQILPAQAAPGANDLKVQVTGRNNPVNAGSFASYSIIITNLSANPQRQVKLNVAVPENMTFVDVPQSYVKYSVIGRNVQFEPLLEMKPGESVPYELRLRADRQGTGQINAEATSATTPKPLTGSTTTSIVGQ
jgi:uncharacterized repeat protein (TIGR01451 family)